MSFGKKATDRNAETIRAARVTAARRNTTHWVELQESALVRRNWWLVHSETDEAFTHYRSIVFEPGTASIAFQANVPMWFYVDADGDVVFLERDARTWTQHVEKQARRSRAPA